MLQDVRAHGPANPVLSPQPQRNMTKASTYIPHLQ